MKKAYLFPGQGSQFVGMAKELSESHPEAKKRFEEANDILGLDLASIMFEGPESKLKQTEFTQPAIFVHSVVRYQTLDIDKPDMVAGHSLGEFSALVANGAISFEDGLKLVRKRGQLMQEAGIKNPGAMAAVIGMDDDKVAEICEDASEKTALVVIPANFNCPGQVVISGNDEAVDEAIELMKKAGCRMAKKLPVSGAFHSPLMRPALNGLESQLESTSFKNPEFPVYANVDGKPTTDAETIKENLRKQLLNAVQWTKTLENMHADGAGEFVEIGPGKVLQGLVKRTLKKVEINGYQ
jgi:[acyl-carrier-protein] S-malonyltransferase